MSSHPPLDALLDAPDDSSVARHLAACPRCRVDLRVIHKARSIETEGLEGLAAARSAFAHAHSAGTTTLTRSTEGVDPTPELEPGQEVERYVVEEYLASGGMGLVYRVRHRRLESLHALKVVQVRSPGHRERLAREGRAQSRLNHPNVVSVTDVVDVHGTLGLILEYVDGPSLDAWLLVHGPPPIAEGVELGRGVLRGVAAAHRAGFVHRDLKPGNVLLSRDGDRLVPKVTDFGLVRSPEDLAEHAMTRSELAMGTPGYMAPEQMRDAASADARSDVFSLGCLLYELFTGRRPFAAAGLLSAYERIRSGQYTPVEDLVPALPEHAARAIGRALRFDPAARFADAGALLRAWEAEAPARRPTRVAVLGVGALVLVGALTVAGWLAGEGAEAPTAYEARRLPMVDRHHNLRMLALRPDGKVLAHLQDGVFVRDLPEGGPERVLAEGADAIGYGPEGRLWLLGSIDGVQGLFRMEQGTPRRVLEVGGVGFELSPDGQRVAVADTNGLRVYDLATGEERLVHRSGASDPHPHPLIDVFWSPDGEHLAVLAHAAVTHEALWIEIVAADGSSSRRIHEDARLRNFIGFGTLAWVEPDRLLFAQVDRRRHPVETTLRAVDDVSSATAADFAEAEVVYRVSGGEIRDLDPTPDGRRIAMSTLHSQFDLWAVPLANPADRRQVTREGYAETALAWLDDETLLIHSDRDPDPNPPLYRQALAGGPPTVFARVPANPLEVAVVDGQLLYFRAVDEEQVTWRLERLLEGAAAPETVLTLESRATPELRCTRHAPPVCLVARPLSSIEWTLAPLDLAGGQVGSPIGSVLELRDWRISPDGGMVASVGYEGGIALLDVATGAVRHLDLAPFRPQHLTWGHDGRELYVTGMSDWPPYQLRRVPLSGESELLWGQGRWWLYRPKLSPDGKTLVLGAYDYHKGAWLLDEVSR